MSPDMKRLVEAAYKAALKVGIYPVIDAEAEAIVRAVLMELREPSEAALQAAYYPTLVEDAKGVVQELIDHILAEPATA